MDYRIQARKALMLDNQSKAKLEGVQLVQYEENQEAGWVSSDSGTYYFKDVAGDGRAEKDIVLRGKVRMRRSDGSMVETTEAIYQGALRKMLSNHSTYIRMPWKEAQAVEGECQEFELDRSKGQAEMVVQLRGSAKERAHATIMPNPEGVAPPPEAREEKKPSK